jgi:hypothetical protein
MKTLTTPYTFDVILLDKNETYDGLNDGKERTPDCVVVRLKGDEPEHERWVDNYYGNPLSELSEEQARKIAHTLPIGYDLAENEPIEVIQKNVAQALQSNGYELRVGERPNENTFRDWAESVNHYNAKAKWDAAYPPEQIVLKLKQ